MLTPLYGALGPLGRKRGAAGLWSGWSGLVAYWNLDEASGARADSVGGYTLTDNNTVGSAAGMNNLAASFVAANSESLSTTSNLGIVGDVPFTAAFWFKPGDYITYAGIIGRWGVGGWLVLNSAGGDYIYGSIHDGAAQHDTPGVVAAGGVWHLGIASYDPTTDTYSLWVDDGTPVTSSNSLGIADPGGNTEMGGVDGLQKWNGDVDEVAIFNEVKDAAWRTAMYNAGAGRFYPE